MKHQLLLYAQVHQQQQDFKRASQTLSHDCFSTNSCILIIHVPQGTGVVCEASKPYSTLVSVDTYRLAAGPVVIINSSEIEDIRGLGHEFTDL